jgi:hypothetical protein
MQYREPEVAIIVRVRLSDPPFGLSADEQAESILVD